MLSMRLSPRSWCFQRSRSPPSGTEKWMLSSLSSARSKSVKRPSETTSLDSILNPEFFGGASAKGRAAQAQQRVEAMDWERVLLVSLEEAKSPEEKARIKADIDFIKDLIR